MDRLEGVLKRVGDDGPLLPDRSTLRVSLLLNRRPWLHRRLRPSAGWSPTTVGGGGLIDDRQNFV